MKLDIFVPNNRRFRRRAGALAACIAVSLVIPPSIVSAEEGMLTQLLSLEANLKMQLQTYVNQSIKGTAEAMQEGPARDPSQPFTLADLQNVQQKNQTGYDTHKKIGDLQQQLLNNKAQILKELPLNDPRRTPHEAEFKQIASQLPDSRSEQGKYKQKLTEADAAIDRWKQKTEPDYTPPPKKTGSSGTGTGGSGPGGPSKPGPGGPTGPGSGGGSGPTGPGGWTGSGPTGPVRTGGNINTLKANEAALENEARNLGKIREAAVIKYLNDPTDENKAAAQAIKKKLDKLVGELNDTRNKVDGLSGGSRPPLKIRTPKQIAKKAGIKKLGKPKGGSGGEDHHHGPGGTDASSSESHHGPDGTDMQSGQRKTKAGKQKGQGKRQAKGQGKGQGKRRKAQASSQTHQHGPGGYDIPGGQSQTQKAKKRIRKQQRKAGLPQ